MGFLSWLKENPESNESQLDLLGSSQPLVKRERVDGAIVNKDFRAAIDVKGGSEEVYPRATDAITTELFDMRSKDLYRSVGGKPGRRETLPKEAQKAFIAAEIQATHAISGTELYSDDQDTIDACIVETSRAAGKKTRKWLPW
jgi:hypothetical protein